LCFAFNLPDAGRASFARNHYVHIEIPGVLQRPFEFGREVGENFKAAMPLMEYFGSAQHIEI
jgi:hypothetical protein